MTKLGVDYLGGANYIDTIVNCHPEGYAAGFLMKCSGWKNGMLAAKALAATGKCPAMRFHGIWLDNHSFNASHILPAVVQAVKVSKLKEQYPDIEMYYSPWLEANCTVKDARQCRKECRAVLPKEIKLVGFGNNLKAPLQEVHHSPVTYGKYIFSFDGCDMLDTGVMLSLYKRIHAGSKYFFFWTPQCNGLKSLTDNNPRDERTNWLTKRLINKMINNYEGA